jgi:hypothetical protein
MGRMGIHNSGQNDRRFIAFTSFWCVIIQVKFYVFSEVVGLVVICWFGFWSCYLLLSCGLTSIELIFGFTLVTSSVGNRSHI